MASLFDLYKLALDLNEKESDRFWTRNNVFLLIQAGLIAFYTNLDKSAVLFRVILSGEGFFLALIWGGVLAKGARYVERWDKVCREIEQMMLQRNEADFVGLKARNDAVKLSESYPLGAFGFLDARTTVLFRYAIYSLMIFWALVFFSSVLRPLLVLFT